MFHVKRKGKKYIIRHIFLLLSIDLVPYNLRWPDFFNIYFNQKKHLRVEIESLFDGNRLNMALTLDCSAKPVMMTMTWSAMCRLASSGMGTQTMGPAALVMAVCVSDPISSHDSSRMCPTQSMNSLGLRGQGGIKIDFFLNIFFLNIFKKKKKI